MKVVPEDVLTCPLGTVLREPQSTAVEYEHSGFSVTVSCYSRAQVGASGVHVLFVPQV